MSPAKKILFRLLTFLVLVAVFCGGLGIPFFYETQTLWYKVGWDRILLRLGHLVGMLLLLLLSLQVMLSLRGKFLEDLFGVAQIMKLHRQNGVLIAFFAVAHVGLVLVPEGLVNLPIGWKFWPEMIGGLLLWILLSMAISSHYRERLKLDYKRWRSIHKVLGYVALIAVFTHAYFVSESFSQVVPRVYLGILAAVVGLRIVVAKYLSR